MDGMFQRPKRRENPDLNIVPVLDMLVAVIFFLILTTSFMRYTKLSLPPSAVSTITNPVAPPPLSPKLVVADIGGTLRLVLTWAGTDPGQKTQDIHMIGTGEDKRKAVLKTAGEFIGEFHKKFPGEKTLQIGLGANVTYQNLVTIMDAVKEKMPDMVLFSYAEADTRVNRAKIQ